MGLCVRVLVAGTDADLEVLLDLVDERDALTGELARGALQRDEVRPEELLALVGQVRAVELSLQLPGVVRERLGVQARLVVHGAAQRGVAGERVDETGHQAPEPQPENQISAHQLVSVHESESIEPLPQRLTRDRIVNRRPPDRGMLLIMPSHNGVTRAANRDQYR